MMFGYPCVTRNCCPRQKIRSNQPLAGSGSISPASSSASISISQRLKNTSSACPVFTKTALKSLTACLALSGRSISSCLDHSFISTRRRTLWKDQLRHLTIFVLFFFLDLMILLYTTQVKTSSPLLLNYKHLGIQKTYYLKQTMLPLLV